MMRGLQKRLTHLNPFTIAIIYALMGALWVLVSDQLLFVFTQDSAILERIGIIKGWFYVIGTTILLYILVSRFEKRLQSSQARLQETQRYVRTLFSNLPGMAYRCRNDANWTMLWVSEGVQGLTDYKSGDLIDNHQIAYGDLIHSDDRTMVLKAVQAALTARAPFRVTYRITTASGQQKWVWEQGSGVFSPTGAVEAIEGFVTDVTEQKQAELDLTIAHQTLERRVAERTQEIERRRRVAEGLLDILAALNSNLPLEQILQAITAQATHLLGSDADAVYRLQEENGMLIIETSQGLPDVYIAEAAVPLGIGALGGAVSLRQPRVIEDVTVARDSTIQDEPTHQILTRLAQHYRSVLAIPLIIRDTVYGGMVLYYLAPRAFSDEDIALAVSFSNQVALAIENARLLAEAEEAAIANERNRLARELHDAVTQTLFSSTMIAEVLPEIWTISPDEGHKRLAELREMTRGALAEMRMLLLELRPSTLIEMPLEDLLRQLAEALQGRARVPVGVEFSGEAALPADVKIVFYRIVQEALNNILKHAEANQVTVALDAQQPGRVVIDVVDDGRGFDPTEIAPGHLGLTIMRERAKEVGIKLEIKSQLSNGTQIRAIWYDTH